MARKAAHGAAPQSENSASVLGIKSLALAIAEVLLAGALVWMGVVSFKQSAAATANLSADPRNADFAVDPNRSVWNFEAPEEKIAYLTFDDGPSANTQAVLDILDQYGIKATFFVTNFNPDYLGMIRESYARGHTIGLHSYSHDYKQIYASPEAYWTDLNTIGNIVKEQIGYVPCFIRFPAGSGNTEALDYAPGIMTELTQQVVAQGYQYFDWTAYCGDGGTHTADELTEAAVADLENAGTNVVFLMHDNADKQTSVEALPRIIEYLQAKGYRFAAIDRSTCVPHQELAN